MFDLLYYTNKMMGGPICIYRDGCVVAAYWCTTPTDVINEACLLNTEMLIYKIPIVRHYYDHGLIHGRHYWLGLPFLGHLSCSGHYGLLLYRVPVQSLRVLGFCACGSTLGDTGVNLHHGCTATWCCPINCFETQPQGFFCPGSHCTSKNPLVKSTFLSTVICVFSWCHSQYLLWSCCHSGLRLSAVCALFLLAPIWSRSHLFCSCTMLPIWLLL